MHLRGLLTAAFVVCVALSAAGAAALLVRTFDDQTRADSARSSQTLKDSLIFGWRLGTK